jgi:hypothetical protein
MIAVPMIDPSVWPSESNDPVISAVAEELKD